LLRQIIFWNNELDLDTLGWDWCLLLLLWLFLGYLRLLLYLFIITGCLRCNIVHNYIFVASLHLYLLVNRASFILKNKQNIWVLRKISIKVISFIICRNRRNQYFKLKYFLKLCEKFDYYWLFILGIYSIKEAWYPWIHMPYENKSNPLNLGALIFC